MLIECTGCHEVKGEAEFYRDKKKLNGRQGACKVCAAASQKEQRAIPEVKEARAAYKKAHRAIPEVREKTAAQTKAHKAIPEVRERNQARAKEYQAIPEVAAAIKEWNQSDVGKASKKKHNDKRRATPEGQQKDKARIAVRDAVRAGRMIKPERCSLYFPFYPICEGRIEGHHYKGYDPEHWLDVEWICRYHHDMSDKLAEHTLNA